MPTPINASEPIQIPMTGTWIEVEIPAAVTGIIIQPALTGDAYLRWAGVAEGDPIGVDYLVVPAGGEWSGWLPGTGNGGKSTREPGEFYLAGAAGNLVQVQVS